MGWRLEFALLSLAACSFDSGGIGESGASSSGGSTYDGGSSSDNTLSTTSDAVTSGGPGATTESTGPAVTQTGGSSSMGGSSEGSGEGTSTGASVELEGLRIELACIDASTCGAVGCDMTPLDEDTATLMGDELTQYDVTLRFRGVVEQNDVVGGTKDGMFHIGGTASPDGWNIFSLTVSDPPQVYYLNSGMSFINYCFPIDYTKTIPVQGGATVTLHGDNGGDVCGVLNMDDLGNPLVIPNIPPDPLPFDGQFIQVDVMSISGA